MRILSLYPNADGYGRIPTGMAIIMTILKKEGHQLDLFDTTFLHADNRDNDTRLRAGLVKTVKQTPKHQQSEVLISKDGSMQANYEALSHGDMLKLFQQKIESFQPSMIIVSLVEDNYFWANQFLRLAKSLNREISIVVGGPTPSAVPNVVIENPCIDFLVQGEGEYAICELCNELEGARNFESIKNLWYKDGDTIRHNPLRPFLDMNTLPIQEIELWDRRHFYKPYDGIMYWTGYFEMSRGCPYSCTYCVNHTIRRSLKSAGRYFRRKSPLVALKEIKHHIDLYQLERIVFCDDNFLLMSGRAFKQWAKDFRRIWNRDINRPYWITTSADFINKDTLKLLKDTGCDGIGIGVEAGGEWFKRKILKRPMNNQKLVEIFQLVQEFGIRTTANIMMGFPGEFEFDIFESIKLIKRIRPDSFDISLVAPYIGTDIHHIATSLKLIDQMTEPGFRGMCPDISFRQHSNIKNPNIHSKRISELYDTFVDYVEGRLDIPEQYREEAPGASKTASPRKDINNNILEILKIR